MSVLKHKQLYEEYIRLEKQVAKLEVQLSNVDFVNKAPKAAVELSQQKLTDFTHKLQQHFKSIYDLMLQQFGEEYWFAYYVQYERDNKYFSLHNVTFDTCNFDSDYFDSVYSEISELEIVELLISKLF